MAIISFLAGFSIPIIVGVLNFILALSMPNETGYFLSPFTYWVLHLSGKGLEGLPPLDLVIFTGFVVFLIFRKKSPAIAFGSLIAAILGSIYIGIALYYEFESF